MSAFRLLLLLLQPLLQHLHNSAMMLQLPIRTVHSTHVKHNVAAPNHAHTL